LAIAVLSSLVMDGTVGRRPRGVNHRIGVFITARIQPWAAPGGFPGSAVISSGD
jgi:hypothetical protein